jgi:two-component system nitrogen regulation sensor histidine kinase GlnL
MTLMDAEGQKSGTRPPRMDAFTNALPHPVLLIEANGRITEANAAAESFFHMGRAMLRRHHFHELVGRHSPATSLVEQVLERGSAINEYRIELSDPKRSLERTVDIYASAVPEAPGLVLVMLQEQTIAEKFSRQLTHRGAARSVSALAAMLAHEIKNPLSGIRGAAQLLDGSVNDDDRLLTQLIRDETDRIVKLVDRFEMFSDGRPMPMEAVNVHAVLEHVKMLARSGFARHIRFVEDYDPSLPPVLASRDQLVQVFLNLVKNAAEAIGNGQDGEIVLSTSFRPGVSLSIPGSRDRIRLPLEVCVRDNGPGVPQDILQNLFEPFVTTKSSGTGLGLALVAKVIGDHGGIIECESVPRRTVFRILLPVQTKRRPVEAG